MSYECPVCRYQDMPHPPTDFSICSCCGTEFELDDADKTHSTLRAEWIAKGAPWFSVAVAKPWRWDAFAQLTQARIVTWGYSAPHAATLVIQSANDEQIKMRV